MLDMKETDLYYPIHHYLVDNGYTVNSEVQYTDIIAQKDDDMIAIELKKTFNATVLIQAVERQKFADSVYIAIVRPKKRSQMKNWNCSESSSWFRKHGGYYEDFIIIN